jgi:para-aminobenzoate synthetase/4-amino-4-deoxychorismate lyase
LKAALAASEKNRAENLMIVDLIRNDLGRVAKTASVRVDELFAVETYPTVHQMVSTVAAELRPGTAPSDLVAAMFPCGSVTGAPKFHAMEIVRELEIAPRGLYCGAVGRFSPGGSADFNVAIRTLTIAGNAGELGVGGGVVADSAEAAEYEECLLKARYYILAREPLSLIETLKFEPGRGFVRGTRHLARLARSARHFGIPFDAKSARRTMDGAVKARRQPARIRLELNEQGGLDVAVQDLPPAPVRPWTYAVADLRVQSTDPLARHKTNWRAHLDNAYARLHAATGCDQVLFLNERGELAEGNYTNVFVRLGKRLLTPPLSSGVLDGVFRRGLLESGQCSEAVLYLADLMRGEVFFGNSLRGLIPAVLAGKLG